MMSSKSSFCSHSAELIICQRKPFASTPISGKVATSEAVHRSTKRDGRFQFGAEAFRFVAAEVKMHCPYHLRLRYLAI